MPRVRGNLSTPLPGSASCGTPRGQALSGRALVGRVLLGGALLGGGLSARSSVAYAAEPPAVSAGAAGAKPPAATEQGAADLARAGCPRSTRFWQLVKGGVRERYCALLRSGRAVVWVEPWRAQQQLIRARALAGGTLVVREELELAALHALASEDARAAHGLFSGVSAYAGSWDAARVETELARARAAFLADDLRSASAGYGEALMHLDEITSAQERARAFIEGALVATLEGRFPEADAYLGGARAEEVPLLGPVVAASRLFVNFRRGMPLGELARERALLEPCASLGWILERQPRARGGPGELLPVAPERTLGELGALAELSRSVADAEAALHELAAAESAP